jgi:hypothetical protein
MFEYNILNTLQQMTMAANAYKTQTGTPNKAIVELLITGFSCQLKGWWDYYLTETNHLHILNSIQTYEDQTPIIDPSGNTIQDVVSTLILTISLHFVGDPSHLKDKNVELLFKSYFFNVGLQTLSYIYSMFTRKKKLCFFNVGFQTL